MALAVKLSDSIIAYARIISKALNRSVSGQIEHWAKIGRIAEENPEMNFELIRNLLIAKEEARIGELEPYKFEKKK